MFAGTRVIPEYLSDINADLFIIAGKLCHRLGTSGIGKTAPVRLAIGRIDIDDTGRVDSLRGPVIASMGLNIVNCTLIWKVRSKHRLHHISASFAAVIPNLRMMEVDAVAWKRDFYANPARIKDGTFVLYDRPGWGTDIVDSAVVARPPQR